MGTKITEIAWIKARFVKKPDKIALFCKKNARKVCQFQKKHYLCIRNRERCSSQEDEQAEIAQLVEHNLAKVGVAGPSPVFRSLVEQKRGI